jgi:hypothetical protein
MTALFTYQPVEDVESEGTWWVVRNIEKTTCAQIDYYSHDDYEDRLIVQDGFRWCEYRVQTSDGNPPNFEFTFVPGGDGKKDSINLNDCCVNNIIRSELVELSDGGCFGETQWPSDIDDETMNELIEMIREGGYTTLEFEKNWNLDETEVWVWGPIEICDEEGMVIRQIIADDAGNAIELKA